MDRMSVAERWIGRLNLRFPTLFVLFAVLTLIDAVTPDLVPFIDEIGLFVLTLILGAWKRRRTPSAGDAVAPDQR